MAHNFLFDFVLKNIYMVWWPLAAKLNLTISPASLILVFCARYNKARSSIYAIIANNDANSADIAAIIGREYDISTQIYPPVLVSRIIVFSYSHFSHSRNLAFSPAHSRTLLISYLAFSHSPILVSRILVLSHSRISHSRTLLFSFLAFSYLAFSSSHISHYRISGEIARF